MAVIWQDFDQSWHVQQSSYRFDHTVLALRHFCTWSKKMPHPGHWSQNGKREGKARKLLSLWNLLAKAIAFIWFLNPGSRSVYIDLPGLVATYTVYNRGSGRFTAAFLCWNKINNSAGKGAAGRAGAIQPESNNGLATSQLVPNFSVVTMKTFLAGETRQGTPSFLNVCISFSDFAYGWRDAG